MSWLEAVLLGIVQGFTEFLPVSSSGHLVILQSLFNYAEHDIAFDIAVHLATLFSVFTIYHRTLFQLLKSPVESIQKRVLTPGLRVILLIICASIPTGIIGLTFKAQFESLFDNLGFVGGFLIFTGTILFLTRMKKGELHSEQSVTRLAQEMTFGKAVAIGFAQSLAIAPGVSRSGSTIAASLFLGISRDSSALFSFLISIPAILGASFLQLSHLEWAEIDLHSFALGFILAYLSGVVGLSLVLAFVKRGRLEIFSPYLWIVGSLCLYFGFGL